MFYHDIAELQKTSANQFVKKSGAGYVPNNADNPLSRCAYSLGDTFDPIPRDTVIEEIECRSRSFGSSFSTIYNRCFV